MWPPCLWTDLDTFTRGMGLCPICRATANGTEFEDTKKRGKPIVFRYGSRPFTGGLCQGVEEALASMRSGAAGLRQRHHLHVVPIFT